MMMADDDGDDDDDDDDDALLLLPPLLEEFLPTVFILLESIIILFRVLLGKWEDCELTREMTIIATRVGSAADDEIISILFYEITTLHAANLPFVCV